MTNEKNIFVQPSRERQQLDVIGSPVFSVSNTTAYKPAKASILAGEQWELNLESYAPFNKYLDYNDVTIVNLGTSHVRFYWNKWDDLGFFIPSSGSREIQREGFREFKIENLGTTDLIPSQIEVSFYKTGLTADERAKQLGPIVGINDILKRFKLVSR